MSTFAKTLLLLVCVTVLSMGVTATAFASGSNDGKPGDTLGQKNDPPVARITEAEARAVAMKAGATGYKALPAETAAMLAAYKPFPSTIAKQEPPAGVLKDLPVHMKYQWVVAGQDLVLIAKDGGTIDTVLRGVFK